MLDTWVNPDHENQSREASSKQLMSLWVSFGEHDPIRDAANALDRRAERF